MHNAAPRLSLEPTIHCFVAVTSTTPESTGGDVPQFYGFSQEKELDHVLGILKFQDFRPARIAACGLIDGYTARG